jgi:hypothetical protein
MNNLKVSANGRINYDLKSYSKIVKELKSAEALYEGYLNQLAETDPTFEKLKSTLDNLADQSAQLKKRISDYVRAEKVSLKSDGISAKYSNPMEVNYDVDKMLDLFPEAEDIPRLVVRTIDPEMCQTATAAGIIPEEVEAGCRIETPKYKQGRVTVTVLKES